MAYTPASITGDHVVITGPITGVVELPDGTRVDVTAPVVAVSSEEQAAEVAHAIGQHWAQPENVHPGQLDVDPDTGEVKVLPFEYNDSHYKAATKRAGKKS